MSMQHGPGTHIAPVRQKVLGIVKAQIATQHMVKCTRVEVDITDSEKQGIKLMAETQGQDAANAEHERLKKRWRPQRTDGAGEMMAFTVKDRRRDGEGRGVCICLTCQRTYKSERDMRQNHPDHAVLVRQNETHVWCWWSDEPITETRPNALSPTFPPIEVATVVGLMSDEG